MSPEAVSVRLAAEADARDWDDFVAAQPGGRGCHEWPWRRVFERALKQKPVYLIARTGGTVEGVLPLVLIDGWIAGRALISLPFLNYGGVLASSVAARDALLASASQLAESRRCQYVELRHVDREFPDQPCRQHKVSMILPLQQPEAMWESLDRKVRNQIRKARKSELVSECGGAELLDDFYDVFSRNMRDLGTPVYSRALFAEILAAFPHRASLHIVRLGSRAIAAGISFITRSTLEVPSASSLREHNPLCPNHLLYWSIIEHAIAQGCDTLDFGRSTPGQGPHKFKEQWGAKPLPLTWEYQLVGAAAVPNTGPSNPKFKYAIELWKHCPLWLANTLGPHITRAVP